MEGEASGAYLLVGPIAFPDVLLVLTQAFEYLFDCTYDFLLSRFVRKRVAAETPAGLLEAV